MPESDLLRGRPAPDGPSATTGSPGLRAPRAPRPVRRSDREDREDLARAARRRNAIAAVVTTLLLLAVGGLLFRYGLSPLLRPGTTAEGLPPTALIARDAAVTLLRKDDPTSQLEALERFTALVQAHPTFLDALSFRVITLAFLYDDARLAVQALDRQRDRLDADILALTDAQSPGDWRTRVNALLEEREQGEKERAPLEATAARWSAALESAFHTMNAQLPEGADVPAPLLRAQAVYFGTKGAVQAVALGERYRLKVPSDGWADVAFAEYALNGGVRNEVLTEALARTERLRLEDAAFIRTHLLSARLSLLMKEEANAKSTLDLVLGFNPSHTVARNLREEMP